MKVAEYIQKNKEAMPPELAEMLTQETSIWSNDACYGYVIIAMRNAGYKEKDIDTMIRYLHSAFEEYMVEEAEKEWINY